MFQGVTWHHITTYVRSQSDTYETPLGTLEAADGSVPQKKSVKQSMFHFHNPSCMCVLKRKSGMFDLRISPLGQRSVTPQTVSVQYPAMRC